MILRLLILFTLVPLVELWLLMRVAKWISSEMTILIVLLTGVVGTLMARSQGLQAFQNLRRNAGTARGATDAILDAAMILIAGLLLITPGILTDAVGISLLIPGCRRGYRALIAARWARRSQSARPPRDDTAETAASRVIDSYVVSPGEDTNHQEN